MQAGASTGHRSNPRRPNQNVAVASLTIATATVLPLLFWIGTEETFALPKLIGMTVTGLAGLALLVWRVAREGIGSANRRTLPDLLVGVFLLLVLVSLWQSIDRGQSFLGERFQRQGFLAMAGYIVAYCLARVSISDEKRLRLLCRAATIAGTVTGVYGLMQWAGADPIWSEVPLGRVFSTLGQSNALGAYLAMSILLTLAIPLEGAWKHGMRVAAIVIQVAALLLTFSRGAYLGLTVGVIVAGVFAVHGWSPGQRRIAPVVALLTVGLVGGVLVISPLGADADRARNRLMAGFNTDEGSVRAHLDFWEIGIAMSADRPFIGSGPDTYVLLFPEYRDQVLPPERAVEYVSYRVESPHNVYLALSTGSGTPAAVAYLALVGMVLWIASRAAWRSTNRRFALVVGCVIAAVAAHMVTDFFMTAELAGSWLAWALLGGLVGVVGSNEDETVRNQIVTVA